VGNGSRYTSFQSIRGRELRRVSFEPLGPIPRELFWRPIVERGLATFF
jgi:hypothetical protein